MNEDRQSILEKVARHLGLDSEGVESKLRTNKMLTGRRIVPEPENQRGCSTPFALGGIALGVSSLCVILFAIKSCAP